MKKQLNDREVNVWRIATIFLAIVVGIILVSQLVEEKSTTIEEPENMVDYLIENQIIFVYSSNCPHCKTQIESFGLDWTRYQNSMLTIDCATQSSVICQNVRAVPSWIVFNGTDYILIKEGVI